MNFLKERRQRHHKLRSNEQIEPKIGEVVIVADDSSPRNKWKLGRIINLPNTEPHQMRSAQVRMANGHILKRSLVHLTPLEIGGNYEKPPEKEQTLPPQNLDTPRMDRKAKIVAKTKIRKIATEDTDIMALKANEKGQNF